MRSILIWLLALTLLLPSTLLSTAFAIILGFPFPLRFAIPIIIEEEPRAVIKVSLFGWAMVAGLVAILTA
jgi:hypothetical protein